MFHLESCLGRAKPREASPDPQGSSPSYPGQRVVAGVIEPAPALGCGKAGTCREASADRERGDRLPRAPAAEHEAVRLPQWRSLGNLLPFLSSRLKSKPVSDHLGAEARWGIGFLRI